MFTTTQYIFFAIVALMIVQRLLELRHSKKNEAAMIARGGREHSPGHFQFMKLVHTFWFVAMIAEVALLDRSLDSNLDWTIAIIALAATLIGQLLRYAAIRTLGPRWSVRIMTVPNSPAVSGGVYRYIRHPNYLGVILEIAAVPLIHGAYITAIVFTILNAMVLWIRIGAEERALNLENGSDYDQRLAGRSRFVGLQKSGSDGDG
ncbi:MAG: isoprenylcysteine carboxyl methyltransferase [bacterium]|nr:isoprenylcysteine carboxyl methyltransferase [bacterium]